MKGVTYLSEQDMLRHVPPTLSILSSFTSYYNCHLWSSLLILVLTLFTGAQSTLQLQVDHTLQALAHCQHTRNTAGKVTVRSYKHFQTSFK